MATIQREMFPGGALGAFLLIILFIVLMWDRTNTKKHDNAKPCSEYINVTVSQLPARCYQELINNK